MNKKFIALALMYDFFVLGNAIMAIIIYGDPTQFPAHIKSYMTILIIIVNVLLWIMIIKDWKKD